MFKIKAQKKVDSVVKAYTLTKEYKNEIAKLSSEEKEKFNMFLHYYISIEFMTDAEKAAFKNYAAQYVKNYDELAKQFIPVIKLDTIKSLMDMVNNEEVKVKVAEVVDKKEDIKKAEAAKKADVKTSEDIMNDVKDTIKESVESFRKSAKETAEKINKKLENDINDIMDNLKEETDQIYDEQFKRRRMSNLEAYSIIARGKISDGIDYVKGLFNRA